MIFKEISGYTNCPNCDNYDVNIEEMRTSLEGGKDMSQLISDPMVHFPTEPQLLPNINIIIEEAVTVIGSVDGPFRLNGTRAKKLSVIYFLY